MKRLFYLLLVFSIAGCSKDEVIPKQEDLIGIWKTTSIDFTGSYTFSLMGLSSSLDFTGKGKNIDYQVTIEEEPRNFTSTGSYDMELYMEEEPPTIFEDESLISSGIWNLDGKILTITQQGTEPQTCTIKKLTAENMTLYTEQSIDMMGLGTYKIKGTFYMVKQ